MKRSLISWSLLLVTVCGGAMASAQLPASSCATLARAGSGVDRFGGTVVRYADHAGTLVDVRVPPRAYEAARASDGENAWYGIPPRPASAAAMRAWERDWGSVRGFGDRAPCVPRVSHRPTSQKRSCPVADRCSLNWSGVYDDAPSNAANTGMTATVRLASSESPCNGTSDHASWVGLGGVHHTPLLQNGVDTAYNGGLNEPYLFWSAVGARGEYYEFDYAPSTYGQPSMGDTVALATTFDRSHGRVTFAFHDVSGSHQALNATPASIGGRSDAYFYDASTAEVMDERPYGDSSLALMPNFGAVVWTGARSFSTAAPRGAAIRNASGASVGMTEGDTGRTIVEPTTVPGHDTADSFQNTWGSCGDADLD